ncbi:ATP-binding cassette domain-containing protein [Labrys sp. KB_33_2]|uniref:ATP-binding cassette domain-containing protein n=1 Tax=Labrys sp. KB_33_2 TaxID=3237479 RepID=UPI003F92265B
MVVPIGVAAPAYFSGTLSFGGLMVTVGAFNQVQSSLRWFVDNFSVIADWRATLLRVSSFRRAAAEDDEAGDESDRIVLAEGDSGHYRLDRLAVFFPGGSTRLREESANLEACERVAIVGERRSGKTSLFRALAGLWRWGSGTVTRPRGEAIMYMPRTPYLPPGSLREVLAYPDPIHLFETDAYETALKEVGLASLLPALDTSKRWDRDLNEDEQQAVAFARLVLHRPAWIIMDEVLDSVTGEAHRRFLQILNEDLRHSGVLHIGRSEGHDHVFGKILHLILARTPVEPTEKVHTAPA